MPPDFTRLTTYVTHATRDAIRTAAFEEKLSISQWIECVLNMTLKTRHERQSRKRSAKRNAVAP